MTTKKEEIQKEITAQIVKALEKGVSPWVKTWQGGLMNIESKKGYNGLNYLMLNLDMMSKGYKTGFYGTFKQWDKKGARINKGEKGQLITYYSRTQYIDKKTEETKNGFILKTSYVFNIDQTNYKAEESELKELERVHNAEETVKNTGANIEFGGDQACFIPSIDSVRMPMLNSFNTSADYYATLFHELGHWTGAKNRLNRDLSGRFGSANYAFEELTAELTAAFLCAEHGIKGALQHENYIGSWIKALKNDHSFIFKASTHAQKAVKFIMNEELTA